MGHDHDAALTHERLAAVHVEHVTEPHAHHEDRVHDPLGVVRADERNTHREDVGLTLDLDDVLGVDVLERDLVDRLGESGLHARGCVRGLDRVEDLALDSVWCAVQRLRRSEVGRPVSGSPLPLAFRQEVEWRRKGIGVDRGLDLEDLGAVIAQHLTHSPNAVMECRVVAVHQAAGVLERLGIVVVAEAAVRGETGRDRLPTAIHRHLVDVGVDDQI